MLYGTEITREITKDETKLCEHLYTFLERYINKRLIYESKESKEDYMQDTIMFLLKRFNDLSEKQKDDLDLENFFYNRTQSFIGNKLRWRKKRRELFRKYADEFRYLASMEKNKTAFIDEGLLSSIISTYKLNQELTETLRSLSTNKLIMLGYFGATETIEEDDVDPEGMLDILSYSVVDEYLVKMARGNANEV